jgi:hypothetical protein
MRRCGEWAKRRMGDDTPDRWGEELGAPRTWLLYQLNAPVLSRSVRVVPPSPIRRFVQSKYVSN